MKKKVSVLLVGVMVLASLSACGSKSKDNASEAASEGASAAVENANDLESLKNLDKLEFKTLAEINPEDIVTVGEYNGITVEVAKQDVTDEDVETYIQNIMATSPAKIEVSDRAVQNGDVANIDYEGKFADTKEAFEGGTAKGYDLEIGSGTFIPGFEDGLVGVSTGETKDIELTFPEDYGAESLAGKKVIFTVTVNKIYEKSTEMTDDWAAGLGMEGVSNLEQLREKSKAGLAEEAENAYKGNLEAAVLDRVNSTSEFKEIPQEVYNRFLIQENKQLEYYAQMYTAYGQPTSASDVVRLMLQQEGSTDDPEVYLKDMVTDVAQQYILFAAIAKKENIVISDEDVDNYLKDAFESAATSQYSSFEEFRNTIEKADFEAYREGLMAEKVIEFMVEHANVVEPAAGDDANAGEAAAEDSASAEQSAE